MSRRSLALPSTRSAEPDDIEQPEAGPEVRAAAPSGGVVAGLTGADTSTPLTVAQLPTPYDIAETVTAPLSVQERGHLDVCEQALTGFRRSVIVAGKALEVINRGRLYRETHATFADYVDDVWEMKRSYAYRMIEGWRPAALVSPIGDIPESQARELGPVQREYGDEVTVALYEGVRELRGDRKVTAADIAEARAVLPPPGRPVSPDKVRDVLASAAATGQAPRLAAPVQPDPEQSAGEPVAAPVEPSDDIGREELREGAEAIAILEAGLAQQRQIYDRVGGGGILAAALLYDPGRADYLQRELRRYAQNTAYRMRDPAAGDDGES